MDRNFRKETAKTASLSPSNAAWIFAQELLGKAVPSAGRQVADARAKREQLEWLAKISPRHESQLRRLLSDEADAKAQRKQLEWLAQISPAHESQLRSLLRAEAEASEE
jgi:hypothetical protein